MKMTREREMRLTVVQWNQRQRRRGLCLVVSARGAGEKWVARGERTKLIDKRDVKFNVTQEDVEIRVEILSAQELVAQWVCVAQDLRSMQTGAIRNQSFVRIRDGLELGIGYLVATNLQPSESPVYFDIDVRFPGKSMYKHLQFKLVTSDGSCAYLSEERRLRGKDAWVSRTPIACNLAPDYLSDDRTPAISRTYRFSRAMIAESKEISVVALKLYAIGPDGIHEIGCAVLLGRLSQLHSGDRFPLTYKSYLCGQVVLQNRDQSDRPEYFKLRIDCLQKPKNSKGLLTY